MECKNIQNTLIDFIEENISENLKVQIEEHLLNCKNCRNEHKQIRQLLNDLSTLEDENPGDQLKVDFYSILEQEKENISKLSKKHIAPKSQISGFSIIKYAAAIIILLGFGFLLGKNAQIQTMQNSEIAALRNEIYTIQQKASMASLSIPTASQRLKAINTIDEQLKIDFKTIALLINTLKNDENVNVRMAAANALAKYSDSKEVRDAFLEVLEKEDDAAMQITLINVLTHLQEQRAKESFEKIVNNNQTLPVVKEQAEEGLKVFI